MAADPKTAFLHLTLPIVGDEPGEDLWGEKLNTNFNLIDSYCATTTTEAPKDGRTYGRLNGTWSFIDAANPQWADIQNKPATFPPTTPIASSDITGLDAKQASQDSAIAANATAISGKEPAITGGTAAQYWAGDKTWKPTSSITVDAYTKAQSDAKYEPIIAPGNAAYFWAGDKTWKAVPAAGVPEAPTDGVAYLRRGSDGSWIAGYPRSGGTIAGNAQVTGNFWVNGAANFDQRPTYNNDPLLTDAPNDGKQYARKSLAWSEVAAAGVPEAPSSGLLYGRQQVAGTMSWVQAAQATIISDTRPTPPPAYGTFWWESDTGGLFIYYSDTDSNQWVQVNSKGLADAPSDDGDYVRINGVWRQKSKRIDVTAPAGSFIMPIPDGVAAAKITIYLRGASGVSLQMRLSADGTNFPNGAGDYTYAGFANMSGTTGYQKQAGAASSVIPLTFTSDNTGLYHTVTMMLVTQKAAGAVFTAQHRGDSYNSAAAYGYVSENYNSYSSSATLTAATQLRAFQVITGGPAILAGHCHCEWIW